MPIPIGYHENIITPDASRKIEAMWSFVAQKSGSTVILPDGRCDLIIKFNTKKSKTLMPIITGPATQPYQIEFEKYDTWIGVRLRPGNGQLLWQKDICRAKDQLVRGLDVIKHLPKLNNIFNFGLDITNIQIEFKKFLAAEMDIKLSTKLIKALEFIHQTGGRGRIEAIANSIQCSSRQLSRIFINNVGLTTKDYACLVQFHRALKLVNNEGLPLADAAFEAGYADQAHMNRSFKRFGGFTPNSIPEDLSIPGLFN
ncbi:MAG: helix-turn-helix transcriptional regulator [Rhizobiales bacterium]|nr:helix-turn-helix transcriptional regulator [Hyphomicrobiales bacterium]